MDPEHRVAVVSGASRGIGRAIVLRLAEAGFAVWALARSDPELKKLVLVAKGSVRPLHVDVSQPQEIIQACIRILAEAGTPEVLVNNAGIPLSAPLQKTELDAYEQLMAVNARAPFLFCRELVPRMAERRSGRVINIASTAGLKGFRYTAAYCASKHALIGLTRALAAEFAEKNVAVNAVCPGWTDTDMLARAVESISKATGRSPAQAREALQNMNPMHRLIRPEDVAELVAFLASGAATAITGSIYPIDAGELV